MNLVVHNLYKKLSGLFFFNQMPPENVHFQ